MSGFGRILLIRLSALGDCVHATPVVETLRRELPEAEIGWAIEAGGHELLRELPGVDRFHVFPRRARGWQRISAMAAFRKELRAARYEVAIDLQGLTKSGFVARLSGASLRLGFAGAESRELNRIFLNRRLAAPNGLPHVVDRNLFLLGGLDIDRPQRARFVLPAWQDVAPAMEGFLDGHGLDRGTFAIVNPGTTWETKLWPRSGFAEVATSLADRLPVVVTWGHGREEEDARQIVTQASSSRVILAPRTGLRELAYLIGRAGLFVGNDTGPLHFAAAQEIPCVAVFGATDPLRNGPYGEGHRVLTVELECQPCFSGQCRRHDLACLTGVSSAMVIAACKDVLEARQG